MQPDQLQNLVREVVDELKTDVFVVPYSRSVQNVYICDGGGFNFSGFYIG